MIKVYICIYPDKVGSVSLEQLQNKRNLEIQNQQQQQQQQNTALADTGGTVRWVECTGKFAKFRCSMDIQLPTAWRWELDIER